MNVQFRIKSNRFGSASGMLKSAIGRAFASSGQTIFADMQRRTPVDTGALRASESVTTTDTSITLRAGSGEAGAYAIYVHQGTHRMSARPFMVDAVNAGASTVAQAIASEAQGEFG